MALIDELMIIDLFIICWKFISILYIVLEWNLIVYQLICHHASSLPSSDSWRFKGLLWRFI